MHCHEFFFNRSIVTLFFALLISACGGGGSGAPSVPTPPAVPIPSYGSLNLVGTDTSVFGSNFSAASGGPQFNSDGVTLIGLIWANTTQNGVVGSTHQIAVTVFVSAGAPTRVSLIASNQGQSWLYGLDCNGVCGNVVIDIAANRVTFSNVVVTAVAPTNATGTLTLTGTVDIVNL